tara:strand:- start:337 stop:549 length:213 start_codon:yes stop_codon:yes gene_type:complete
MLHQLRLVHRFVEQYFLLQLLLHLRRHFEHYRKAKPHHYFLEEELREVYYHLLLELSKNRLLLIHLFQQV